MRALIQSLTVLTLSLIAVPALAEPGVQLRLDTVYKTLGESALKLDLAIPSGEGPFPAVLLIHGGSWKHGDKSFFRPMLARFAAEGYVVAAVQYRLVPGARWPAQMEDCREAVRWLRRSSGELGVDPERIGALGFSAGAHLALLLGLSDDVVVDGVSSRVRAVVNFFGPTDLRVLVGRTVHEFMGGTLAERPEDYKAASPLLQVDANDAAVLTLHGTKDPLVPYSQAERLVKALKEVGVEAPLWTAEGAGHGWAGEPLDRSFKAVGEFLGRQLAQKEKLGPKLY